MNPQGHESRAIASAREQFNELLRLLKKLLAADDLSQSAVVAEIAAVHGAYNHHGELISTDFEETLRELGCRIAPESSQAPARRRGEVRNILHVLTAAKDVGGDSRFVWRWIQRDDQRRHSVAVTRQRDFEIPSALRDAVAARGGVVHHLDEEGADVSSRAIRLRTAAQQVDVVFLHVYVEDIIPSLAFASATGLPPIVFVMQADHQFVTGLACSNLVLHMRASGAALSVNRRSVNSDRLTFLPIPLEPIRREQSREAAKRELGLPPDSVLLLSIARAGKFVGAQPPSFAAAGASLLERYPQARLVVLGPKDTGEWRAARVRTNDRFRALGQRSDTKIFYEAADVFLDSYPFSSNTSLLEAGSHGIPLVSLFCYSQHAAVLGAGTPALDEVLNITHNAEDFAAAISILIESAAVRTATGERTRLAIEHYHHGAGWHSYLEQMLERVCRAETTAAIGAPIERAFTDLDVLLSRIFGNAMPLGVAIERRVRELPYFQRLRLLRRLLPIDSSFSYGLLLPSSLERLLSPYFRGWRSHELAQRLLGRP